MIRTVLIYGIICGTIVILSMLLGIITSEGEGFWSSEMFGYSIMLIALSIIFVAIKRHRDHELGGVIRFLPAFGLGIAISAVAGIMYVFVWEMYLISTDYVFIEEYAAGVIANAKASGVSGAALDAQIAETERLVANYGKAWIRLPMTFIEIFPVGFVISLVSAALLRNPKFLPTRT